MGILETERYLRLKNKVDSVLNGYVKVQPFQYKHFRYYLGKDDDGILTLNAKKFESPVSCTLYLYHGGMN